METPINKKEEMKSITFTPTGEVRIPKKGEWYRASEGKICKLRCTQYLLKPTPIYTMTESDVQTEGDALDAVGMLESPIQGSSLNTQKSLGVSEPSLVQENVDSRFEQFLKENRLLFSEAKGLQNEKGLCEMAWQAQENHYASLQAENEELKNRIRNLTDDIKLSHDVCNKFELQIDVLEYRLSLATTLISELRHSIHERMVGFDHTDLGKDCLKFLESQSLPTKDEERK